MIFVVTPDTVAVEVIAAYRGKLAGALRIPESMVTVTLEPNGNGGATPKVDVELPPATPPSTLDVNDPVQMAAWEKDVADMPGITEFIQARGVPHPDRVIDLYVNVMMMELRKRLMALHKRKVSA